jgi:RNA polymerase sigma-70 factor (sigma-E family)
LRANRRDSAFEEFVGARRGHLRRVAYAMCGDWARADDLVQTALERAYLAWPRIRRAGAEEAFVCRIIARANIDESRRPWRRERPSDDMVELDDGSVRSASDHGDEAAVEDRTVLFAALMRLPPMQRKVVVLRHWLDWSVTDTAASLAISEGTVKSHGARGLAALRAALDPLRASSGP